MATPRQPMCRCARKGQARPASNRTREPLEVDGSPESRSQTGGRDRPPRPDRIGHSHRTSFRPMHPGPRSPEGFRTRTYRPAHGPDMPHATGGTGPVTLTGPNPSTYRGCRQRRSGAGAEVAVTLHDPGNVHPSNGHGARGACLPPTMSRRSFGWRRMATPQPAFGERRLPPGASVSRWPTSAIPAKMRCAASGAVSSFGCQTCTSHGVRSEVSGSRFLGRNPSGRPEPSSTGSTLPMQRRRSSASIPMSAKRDRATRARRTHCPGNCGAVPMSRPKPWTSGPPAPDLSGWRSPPRTGAQSCPRSSVAVPVPVDMRTVRPEPATDPASGQFDTTLPGSRARRRPVRRNGDGLPSRMRRRYGNLSFVPRAPR